MKKLTKEAPYVTAIMNNDRSDAFLLSRAAISFGKTDRDGLVVTLYLLLPNHILDCLKDYMAPKEEDGVDALSWKPNPNGSITRFPMDFQLWISLIRLGMINRLCSLDLHSWISFNLSEEIGIEREILWVGIFMITAWKFWNYRNDYVHTNSSRPVYIQRNQIKQLVKEINAMENSNRLNAHANLGNIKWNLPMEGWAKLNTDGASRGNPGLLVLQAS
ncbi:hypothetical protein PIB30_029912 [Stylosanthes scabra]|uniref:Uncharacterized protein n=1 Tax=Stylosanthes scabra TaxID=79078 RepID=A0ABU6SCZ6_9FABA|nr:hypothetical protein [Stylosanthes scabra]